MSRLRWAYGVTTVESRRKDLLPRTLSSLCAAGFDAPRLFVDGTKDVNGWELEFGLDVTARSTNLRTAGNWTLALYELYIRDPAAERYAIFQDDFVICKNARGYLERCAYPEKGYLNLYTVPKNQVLAPRDSTKRRESIIGFYKSNQLGKGAVALVFSREAVTTLLAQQHLVDRPQDVHRGHKSIDGGIVTAFRKAGWSEYVHNPSLVQHTGHVSAMLNAQHPIAVSFPGEDFDCLTLLE